MKRLLVLVALLGLVTPRAVLAQVDRATLTGTVKDSGGAVVPGATVSITNVATERRVAAADHGDRIVSLREPDSRPVPGRCRADRLQEERRRWSRSRSASARASTSTLEVGSLNETVTVTETTQLLNSNDATLGARHPADAGRQPAAGDPQLGRPARARARRPGRPLHRAGRRHVVRPHRRHQRARRPRAAEQLPARRRGQQQHLGKRAGADDAGVAPVGGRDPGIQGRHQPVLGRVRPLAGRRDQRLDQVRHQQDPRHRLRVLPQRVDGLDRLLLEAANAAKADERAEPVRRQPRRSDRQGPRVLLRRLRGHAHHARRDAADPRADGRRARRHLHHARSAIR